MTRDGIARPREPGIDRRFAWGNLGIPGAFLLGLMTASCAEAPLVPLVPTQDGVAVTERSGIQLTAEMRPGLHEVPEDLTPIRISIHNRRGTPIYVALEDIELAGDSVFFDALQPEDIRPRRPVGLGIDPASPYASAFGQTPITEGGRDLGGVSMDPAAPFTSSPRAGDPRRRWIVDSAFNGGYFQAGEREHGFVYFVTPPADVDRLTLRVKVRSGPDGSVVETLNIPYGARG